MGLFGGPSKDVVAKMAAGVASFAAQLDLLSALEDVSRQEILKEMDRRGAPTSMDDLISMAGDVPRENGFGSIRKTQYLGMIERALVQMGMSRHEAESVRQRIELRSFRYSDGGGLRGV